MIERRGVRAFHMGKHSLKLMSRKAVSDVKNRTNESGFLFLSFFLFLDSVSVSVFAPVHIERPRVA